MCFRKQTTEYHIIQHVTLKSKPRQQVQQVQQAQRTRGKNHRLQQLEQVADVTGSHSMRRQCAQQQRQPRLQQRVRELHVCLLVFLALPCYVSSGSNPRSYIRKVTQCRTAVHEC